MGFRVFGSRAEMVGFSLSAAYFASAGPETPPN